MDRKKEFGKLLRDLRTQRGMSQDELAKAIGYSSRSSVLHLETGRNSCTRETVIAICKALNVSPMYFYQDDHDNSNIEDIVCYLKKADDMTLDIIRRILKMPGY